MMSIFPKDSTAVSTSLSATPSLVRSPAKVAVSPRISPADCSAALPSRSLIRTWAPSAASSSAVARPMPRADPVTIADLPSSTPTFHFSLLVASAGGYFPGRVGVARGPWLRRLEQRKPGRFPRGAGHDIEFRTAGLFPGLEDEYHGHDGVREFWFQMHEPFENFSIEPVRVEPHGDAAVIDIHFHAIGKGSGVTVELPFFHAAHKRGALVTVLSSHG